MHLGDVTKWIAIYLGFAAAVVIVVLLTLICGAVLFNLTFSPFVMP